MLDCAIQTYTVLSEVSFPSIREFAIEPSDTSLLKVSKSIFKVSIKSSQKHRSDYYEAYSIESL